MSSVYESLCLNYSTVNRVEHIFTYLGSLGCMLEDICKDKNKSYIVTKEDIQVGYIAMDLKSSLDAFRTRVLPKTLVLEKFEDLVHCENFLPNKDLTTPRQFFNVEMYLEANIKIYTSVVDNVQYFSIAVKELLHDIKRFLKVYNTLQDSKEVLKQDTLKISEELTQLVIHVSDFIRKYDKSIKKKNRKIIKMVCNSLVSVYGSYGSYCFTGDKREVTGVFIKLIEVIESQLGYDKDLQVVKKVKTRALSKKEKQKCKRILEEVNNHYIQECNDWDGYDDFKKKLNFGITETLIDQYKHTLTDIKELLSLNIYAEIQEEKITDTLEEKIVKLNKEQMRLQFLSLEGVTKEVNKRTLLMLKEMTERIIVDYKRNGNRISKREQKVYQKLLLHRLDSILNLMANFMYNVNKQTTSSNGLSPNESFLGDINERIDRKRKLTGVILTDIFKYTLYK